MFTNLTKPELVQLTVLLRESGTGYSEHRTGSSVNYRSQQAVGFMREAGEEHGGVYGPERLLHAGQEPPEESG